MTTYEIDPRANENKLRLTVRAESVEAAATRAARKWFGPRAWANRETGDPGKSGVFQAYIGLSGGNMSTSLGRHFHVSEE